MPHQSDDLAARCAEAYILNGHLAAIIFAYIFYLKHACTSFLHFVTIAC